MVFVEEVIGWMVLEEVQVALQEMRFEEKVEKDSLEFSVVDYLQQAVKVAVMEEVRFLG